MNTEPEGLRRYYMGTSVVSGVGQMYEDADGPWVLYEDVRAALATQSRGLDVAMQALVLLERGKTLEARDLLRRALGHLPSKDATRAATQAPETEGLAEEFASIHRAAGTERVPFEATAHWEKDRPPEGERACDNCSPHPAHEGWCTARVPAPDGTDPCGCRASPVDRAGLTSTDQLEAEQRGRTIPFRASPVDRAGDCGYECPWKAEGHPDQAGHDFEPPVDREGWHQHIWCRETGSSALICLDCGSVYDHGEILPAASLRDSLKNMRESCSCNF